MKSFFDKLNLRPGERRALVAVALVVFVVINLVWVWPRFGDWGLAQKRLAEIRKKLDSYEVVIRQEATIRRVLREFEGEAGDVPLEDQALTLMKAYDAQARASGVLINVPTRPSNRTNENFIEQLQRIDVIGAEESALVDFLYKLGSSGSFMRAKELSLRPDPPHQKLVGSITLAASFQRKVNPRAPVAPTTAPGAAAKPAAKSPATVVTNKPPARGPTPAAVIITNKPAATTPKK